MKFAHFFAAFLITLAAFSASRAGAGEQCDHSWMPPDPTIDLDAAIRLAVHDERYAFMPKIRSTGGVLSSNSTEASLVGEDVLNRGGNAVDAAVATVLAIGVTRPDLSGLGGEGAMVYRSRQGKTAAIDFKATMPGDPEFADTWFEPGMHRDQGLLGNVGHRTAGVPSLLLAMHALLARHGSGKFSLEQLISNGVPPLASRSTVRYAYELARDGAVITPHLLTTMKIFGSHLCYYPDTAEIYCKAFEPGDLLVQSDYARTLKLVMDFGPDAIYSDRVFPPERTVACRPGTTAWRNPAVCPPRPSAALLIAADMAKAEDSGRTNPFLLARYHGAANDRGFLTTEDFVAQSVSWREPLSGDYRGYEIVTAPPSTSGGVITLLALNLLEHFPLASNTQPPESNLDKSWEHQSWAMRSANQIHAMVEAKKIASFAALTRVAGDPDHPWPGSNIVGDTQLLISKAYAAGRQHEIDMAEAEPYPACPAPGTEPADDDAHTNHISVIDADGNAIAVTTSMGYWFGSGVVARGTGFLLANSMSGIGSCQWPLEWPQRGIRARVSSSQAPTIVVKHDRPVLVTGGAGGGAVPMSVINQIVSMVDYGCNAWQVLDVARFDSPASQGLTLHYEQRRLHANLRSELRDPPEGDARGRTGRRHAISSSTILEDYDSGGATLAWANAAGYDHATGMNHAAADPRWAFNGNWAARGYDEYGVRGQCTAPWRCE